jgi:hypothetical protein
MFINDVCNEFAKHFEQIANIPNDAPDDPDIVKRVSDFRTQRCVVHLESTFVGILAPHREALSI